MKAALQRSIPASAHWLKDLDTGRPPGPTQIATTVLGSALVAFRIEGTFVASSIAEEMQRLAGEVGLPVAFPHGLPCLRTRDGQEVPLYQIVEEVEGQVDLGAVADELPRVTYGQLSATMEFVKRLLQLNERQLDIDELEDEFLLQRGLAQELRTAVS